MKSSIDRIKKVAVACAFVCLLQQVNADQQEQEPRVQLAILLDTSNSMDGLIEQAKSQLWKIVNSFIEARKNQQQPFVEVALYEYGNDGLSANDNWIRQVSPFTRDLDSVSEYLFALKTNGGEEYCGAVIDHAIKQLQWDSSQDTYKAVFIAGNEPFTQGSISPDSACKDAQKKGVIVNTIHCGDHTVGIDTGWKLGFDVAGGSYMVINQNHQIEDIEAPQDQQIAELNSKLNDTYIQYGQQGGSRKRKQLEQDANAFDQEESGAVVQRAISKATKNYHNASWDLVDAAKDKKFDWKKVNKSDLPKEAQSLDESELKLHVAQKAKEREDIQKQMLELNKKRNAFVAQERLKKVKDQESTLDAVIVETVKAQVVSKGYRFEK